METDNTKESLIAEWEKAIARTGLEIHKRSEVVAIERAGDLFNVKTAMGEVFKSHFVVVAVGAHGSPSHLNVPGETPERVFYKLIEPDEFQNKRILVYESAVLLRSRPDQPPSLRIHRPSAELFR